MTTQLLYAVGRSESCDIILSQVRGQNTSDMESNDSEVGFDGAGTVLLPRYPLDSGHSSNDNDDRIRRC